MPRPRKVVEAAELYAILQREGADAEELDHTRRQELLLSDIAGFDRGSLVSRLRVCHSRFTPSRRLSGVNSMHAKADM